MYVFSLTLHWGKEARKGGKINDHTLFCAPKAVVLPAPNPPVGAPKVGLLAPNAWNPDILFL